MVKYRKNNSMNKKVLNISNNDSLLREMFDDSIVSKFFPSFYGKDINEKYSVIFPEETITRDKKTLEMKSIPLTISIISSMNKILKKRLLGYLNTELICKVYKAIEKSNCSKLALSGCNRFDDINSNPLEIIKQEIKAMKHKPNCIILSLSLGSVITKRFDLNCDRSGNNLKRIFNDNNINIENIFIESTVFLKEGSESIDNDKIQFALDNKILLTYFNHDKLNDNFGAIIFDEDNPIELKDNKATTNYRIDIINPNYAGLITHCVNNIE